MNQAVSNNELLGLPEQIKIPDSLWSPAALVAIAILSLCAVMLLKGWYDPKKLKTGNRKKFFLVSMIFIPIPILQFVYSQFTNDHLPIVDGILLVLGFAILLAWLSALHHDRLMRNEQRDELA